MDTTGTDPTIAHCALCGELVYSSDLDSCWKEVRGFVGGPKKDSMRLRHDTGRLAHNHCVEKLNDGQAIDQPTLEEEAEDDGKREFVGDDLPF